MTPGLFPVDDRSLCLPSEQLQYSGLFKYGYNLDSYDNCIPGFSNFFNFIIKSEIVNEMRVENEKKVTNSKKKPSGKRHRTC